MAIKIDIPQIGVVEVEGAASEETLQRIATAFETANKGLTKEQKEQTKANKDLNRATKELSTGWVAAGDNLIQSFKNLALTATSVATKFFANYDQIAKNPIKTGTQLINTAIDVTTDFASGLVSAVPVIGGFLKGLVEATGALYKLANETLSKQLEKNVEALKEYAKTGIGFTNGMQDMQRVAQLAGMGITEFSQGVTKAKANLLLLGMSGGEATERLAKNLGQLNKKGPGGLPSLREEIVKMGFSIDDQVDIAAQYMGQMQALGKLEKMSKEELAKGTRDYARDLKVVADFTGKDAKEIRDKSRKASQLAIVQSTLNERQLIAFRGVYESLEKLGPNADKAQRALLQSALGLAINVDGYTQGPLNDALLSMTDVIHTGTDNQATAFASGGDILARALKSPETQKYISGLGYSSVAGISGPTTALIDELNTSIQAVGDIREGQVQKIQDANERQARLTDKLSDNFSKLITTTNDYQVEMESFLNKGVAKQAERTLKANKIGIAMTEAAVGGVQLSPSAMKASDEELRMQMLMTGVDPRTGKGLSSQDYKALLKTGTIPKLNIPGLAGGGTLAAGELGLVGEAGPELITGPAGVTNAAQMRENMAKLFEESAKMLTNANNPFRSALDDVAWMDAGNDFQLPYDKLTGTILEPNFVKNMSDKATGWQKSVEMLSDIFTKDATGVRQSDMLEGLDSETLSDLNKQILEVMQQTRDAATQQTMHMADMLKQMGISTDRLGKIAVNTN